METQYTPVADHALLVTLAEDIRDDVHAAIVAFDQAIIQAKPLGVIEVVPALVNLLVSFDPVVTDHIQVEAALRTLHASASPKAEQATKRTVQVCYEKPFDLDLDAVAKACNLSRDAVIKAHLDGDYKVLMYGFVPGYAYLGGVDASIQVPRKLAAVRDIPAGCVMVAGTQCLVTTLKMPTGWSIIGRSPTHILLNDPLRPFLFDVGDEVTFQRISLDTYNELYAASNRE
ncbi:MAG: allophanate hydrolase subunit 1 [Granulosicoccaceae bacterium]